MGVKRLLNRLTKDQQNYYIFLAKECFSGFSNAENNFDIYRYASCYAWLFHSSEFFWKALTILSGNYFEPKHEASQVDMTKMYYPIKKELERTISLASFQILDVTWQDMVIIKRRL
jgi:hypothetical protein